MRPRESCVDCKQQSPLTETNYTLISSRYGWRVLRTKLPNGRAHVEWRCPDCWKRYKASSGGPSSEPPSGKPPPYKE